VFVLGRCTGGLTPCNRTLQVVFEDDYFAVVVKPPGLPMQGKGERQAGPKPDAFSPLLCVSKRMRAHIYTKQTPQAHLHCMALQHKGASTWFLNS